MVNGPVEITDLSSAEFWSHAAVHEAGHAVVGIGLGLTVRTIKIGLETLTTSELILGGVVFDAPANDHRILMELQPEEMGPTLMAGFTSELKMYGCYIGDSYAGDLNILRRGLHWTDALNSTQQGTVHDYVRIARKLVNQDKRAIVRVAKALIKVRELDGEGVMKLIEE